MKTALVIASYKEIETLPILLEELVKFLNQTDLIVIADDSPSELRPLLEIQCSRILENSGIKSIFSYGQTKSGRGNAIRRGMAEALKLYPDIKYILEMDADSSHQPKDIEYLRDMNSDSDLIIGSRYIYGSEIIGWPISRRFFSKCLNLIIPRILNLKVKDVTNGLRRYTAESAQLILSVEPRNSGFTYLSEQALILSRQGRRIEEIPTTFINRTVGKSTVTYKEILVSLKGILRLIKTDLRQRN